MRTSSLRLSLLAVFGAGLLLTGCAAPGSGGQTVEADGPHGALRDPGAGTLNSPTTSPGSSGLSGGTIGSRPGLETGGAISPGVSLGR